jgi:hypothetical protein
MTTSVIFQIIQPFVRNGLRTASGALLYMGFSDGVASALNAETVVGFGTMVLVEGWYILARKKGWAT